MQKSKTMKEKWDNKKERRWVKKGKQKKEGKEGWGGERKNTLG